MSDDLFYVIMYSVAAVVIYTAILYFGYRKSSKAHKRAHMFMMNLKEVFEDIKHAITKEEKQMEHGDVEIRNGQAFAYAEGHPDGVAIEFTEDMKLHVEYVNLKNELSLSDILTNKPTEENYAEIIDLLTRLAKETYEEFKFFIAKSQDETKQANFLQIVSTSKEKPHLHGLIFGKSVSYGIDMQELQLRFAQHVEDGKVIDLGEDVTVILHDDSPQLATGVSPINNGLEGGEIAFIISFIKKENLEAFNKNNLPQPEERLEEDTGE